MDWSYPILQRARGGGWVCPRFDKDGASAGWIVRVTGEDQQPLFDLHLAARSVCPRPRVIPLTNTETVPQPPQFHLS
jgi:hypothetical protein